MRRRPYWSMEQSPHDHFARRVFSDVDVMRAHLHGFLPEIARHLDLARLRREADVHLDPALRGRHSDLLFSAPIARGRTALVQVLFEHKSTPERFLVFDLQRSAVRILEAWRTAREKTNVLPWIVPIVLYAGPRPFTSPRRLVELCGPSDEVRASLGPNAPDIGFSLVDLSAFTDEELRARSGDLAWAALAHLLLRHVRDPDFLEQLGTWMDLLAAVLHSHSGLDALRSLIIYVVSARRDVTEQGLGETIATRLEPHEQEMVMSTFKSYADVLREEGEARGEARGEAEGRRREAVETLLSLLRRRLGEIPVGVEARIEAAAVEDLHAWRDRLFDGASITEVMGD